MRKHKNMKIQIRKSETNMREVFYFSIQFRDMVIFNLALMHTWMICVLIFIHRVNSINTLFGVTA